MNKSNYEIRETLQGALDSKTASIPFASVWKKNAQYTKRAKTLKSVFIPLITVILCASFFAGGYGLNRRADNTDYKFRNDPRIIGKWETVDYVKEIDDFVPGSVFRDRDLYLKSMIFIKDGGILSHSHNGNLAPASIVWTKGQILSEQEKTNSRYVIKEMGRDTFLFFEWKSGDYIFRFMEPYYYVLRKIDNLDYSDFEPKRIIDNIDYPFIEDPQMMGTWESIDFVDTMEAFLPGKENVTPSLFLTGLELRKKGALTFMTLSGEYTKGIRWTQGLIINELDKTASGCFLEEINGTLYMFLEWKSGDYIFRGEKPRYYVLKKKTN